MGALAGTIGSFLREYQTMVNVISGLVVILFGLNFLGIFKWNLFRGGGKTVNSHEMGFFSAMLFGMVFSLGWTPCVGAFLGSALMLASQQGHVIEGMLMLLCYSLGLGIPFLLSAVLIDYLKSAIQLDKKQYRIINNRVSFCILNLQDALKNAKIDVKAGVHFERALPLKFYRSHLSRLFFLFCFCCACCF